MHQFHDLNWLYSPMYLMHPQEIEPVHCTDINNISIYKLYQHIFASFLEPVPTIITVDNAKLTIIEHMNMQFCIIIYAFGSIRYIISLYIVTPIG
jgi:hypothetical protein